MQVSGGGLRVGIVYATNVGTADILKQQAVDELQKMGVTSVVPVGVPDALQLPFTAQQMIAKGLVDSVIAIAILTEQVRLRTIRLKAAKISMSSNHRKSLRTVDGTPFLVQLWAAKELAGAVFTGLAQVRLSCITIDTLCMRHTGLF